MLSLILVVALGQCAGNSCQAPAVAAPAMLSPVVRFEAPRYAAQEARHAIYESGACSARPARGKAKGIGFRPLGGLFARRRGGCG